MKNFFWSGPNSTAAGLNQPIYHCVPLYAQSAEHQTITQVTVSFLACDTRATVVDVAAHRSSRNPNTTHCHTERMWRALMTWGVCEMTPTEFRNARHRLGITQKEMAERLQLAGRDRTIRMWESGQRAIPGPVVVAIKLFLKDAGK